MDVTKNAALTGLYCQENRLTVLDVTKNIALINLFCDFNHLTALDVTKNTALIELSCYNNQLTTLDVTQNTALTDLSCGDNQLTALDVTQNTALTDLSCGDNQLSALDISKNTALTRLLCYNNKITDIKACDKPVFTSLYCDFDMEESAGVYNFNFTDFQSVYHLGELIKTSVANGNYDNSSGKEILHVSSLPVEFTCKNTGDNKEVEVHVYPFDGSSAAPSLFITTTDLPDGTLSTPYSTTLTASGDTPITWTLPDGLTLNSSSSISGTPTTEGAFTFTVQAQNDSASAEKLFTILVGFSEILPPQITTDALPEGYTSSPYGYGLTAKGTSTITWSLAEGSSLPSGLTLSSIGYISGTPTETGTFTITFQAENSAGTDTATFDLTISAYPSGARPSIMTENPEPATVDVPYTCQLMSKGTPPFKWTLKGKLPKGLTMNESGLITGTPTKTGNKTLKLTVANDYGEEMRKLTLSVHNIPQITTDSLKDAVVGKSYKATIGKKSAQPFVWEIEGTLPKGITMFKADQAKITGTPVTNDKGIVRVTLSNPVGEVSKVFTLKSIAEAPKISPSSLSDGTFGKKYSKTIKAKGTEPITLSISGSLPLGLTFDSSTGKIEGTPFEVCTDSKITVYAMNLAGVTTKEYSLTIKAVNPKITTKSLPEAVQGSEYSATVEAEGTPSITFTAEGLPAGLSMSSSGEISGTPTESGKFTVKVTATNVAKSAEKSLKLKIAESVSSSSASAQAGIVGNVPANERADFDGGYTVVAIMPEISVDVAGMYDFSVELSPDVEGELLYLVGSSEPSDDDEIAEFSDETGEETSSVPPSRKVNLSVWLNPDRTYKPKIAVKH